MRTLALFDFDGTICRVDSFTEFMYYVFDKSYFFKQGLKVLPHAIAYYSNIYPAHRMRAKLYRKMFRNYPLDQALILSEQYAEHLYLNKMNPLLLSRLYWHQQQEHRIIIVSASLDLYLNPLARNLDVEVLCTQVQSFRDCLSGNYATKDCSNEEKVYRIQSHLNLQDYTKIYAYGNSQEDLAMLELADHAYWVDKRHHLNRFHKLTLN